MIAKTPVSEVQEHYGVMLRSAEVHASRAVKAGLVPRRDRADMVQDLLLVASNELQKLDTSRSSPRTFVECVIASRAVSAVRAYRALKRRPAEPFRSDISGPDLSSRLNLAVDVSRAVARLTPFDRLVAATLSQETPADTARLLGIARSTLYKAIARIRDVFVANGVYTAPRHVEPRRRRTVPPATA